MLPAPLPANNVSAATMNAVSDAIPAAGRTAFVRLDIVDSFRSPVTTRFRPNLLQRTKTRRRALRPSSSAPIPCHGRLSGPVPERAVECGADGRCSAKSLLEARVVADGREVVVPRRLVAKPWQQLDRAAEVVERLVAGVAGEGREARIVVVEAGVVRCALEAAADRFERVGVPLLAVGAHRLVVE